MSRSGSGNGSCRHFYLGEAFSSSPKSSPPSATSSFHPAQIAPPSVFTSTAYGRWPNGSPSQTSPPEITIKPSARSPQVNLTSPGTPSLSRTGARHARHGKPCKAAEVAAPGAAPNVLASVPLSASGIEARRVETALAGSVHESPAVTGLRTTVTPCFINRTITLIPHYGGRLTN